MSTLSPDIGQTQRTGAMDPAICLLTCWPQAPFPLQVMEGGPDQGQLGQHELYFLDHLLPGSLFLFPFLLSKRERERRRKKESAIHRESPAKVRNQDRPASYNVWNLPCSSCSRRVLLRGPVINSQIHPVVPVANSAVHCKVQWPDRR